MSVVEASYKVDKTINVNCCLCIAASGRKANETFKPSLSCCICGQESFKVGFEESNPKPYLKCEECGELYYINVEPFVSSR